LIDSSETGQQRLKALSTAVPMGRLGKLITGVELFVDGGFAQV